MLILIGPSASGKTVVAKILATKYHLNKVVTYTTRLKRVNEIDGIDYHFISLEEFASLKERDFFVETTNYNGNFYGTAKSDIQDDRCLILDPNGFQAFQALNDPRIVSIYLHCDESERLQRMIARKDKEEDAKRRISNDKIAFYDKNLAGVTFVVDSSGDRLDEISAEVYNLYMSIIKSL